MYSKNVTEYDILFYGPFPGTNLPIIIFVLAIILGIMMFILLVYTCIRLLQLFLYEREVQKREDLFKRKEYESVKKLYDNII